MQLIGTVTGAVASYSDFRAMDFERAKSNPVQVTSQTSSDHMQTISRVSQLAFQHNELFYMTNGKTLPRVAQYVNAVF